MRGMWWEQSGESTELQGRSYLGGAKKIRRFSGVGTSLSTGQTRNPQMAAGLLSLASAGSVRLGLPAGAHREGRREPQRTMPGRAGQAGRDPAPHPSARLRPANCSSRRAAGRGGAGACAACAGRPRGCQGLGGLRRPVPVPVPPPGSHPLRALRLR